MKKEKKKRTAILNDEHFKNEHVEILETRPKGFYLVRVIAFRLNYYVHEKDLVFVHGDCIEQLTTRKDAEK